MNNNQEERTEISKFVEQSLKECFYRIFKVNVNTGEFEVYKDNGLFDEETLKGIPDIYAFMQKLINDKIIYPEYATICRRFTNPEYIRKSVFSSEKRIVQSYKARTVKGIQWVTFTIIVGHNCSPENPTVLFTWREADSDAMTLLDTFPTISSLYNKLIRINLTNSTYEPVIVDADEQERLVGGVINMYEWWAGYSKNGNIAPEDMGAFSTLTKTGSLQKRFAEDPTPVNFCYRRKVNGEFRWVQLQLAPSVEYSEENQVMLLSLKDVHEEYTAQLKSRQKLVDTMNHDALTNLFNRLKFDDDVDKFAKSDGKVLTCLYIDVNGLHELNNVLGHKKGDDMLCCVADTLCKYFPDDYVYRLGGDEFVVLSVKKSKDDAEIAISDVRRDLLKDNYEISVGIESGECGEGVEKIIATAEREMRSDKAAYYMRKGDRRKNRKMNEELEQILVEKRAHERFLKLITSQYSGVFAVNLNSDAYRQLYNLDLLEEPVEGVDTPFSVNMRKYIENHVKSEYRERFNDVLNYEKLDKKLRKHKTVEFSYKADDGYNMILRIYEDERAENAKAKTLWMIWKK